MATTPTATVVSTWPTSAASTFTWPSPPLQLTIDYGPTSALNIPLLDGVPHANQLDLVMVRYGYDSAYTTFKVPKSSLYFDEAAFQVHFPAFTTQNPAATRTTFTDWANLSEIWPGGAPSVTGVDTTLDYPVLFRSTFSDQKAVDWVPTSRVTGSQLNLMTDHLLALLVEQVNDMENFQVSIWDRGAINGVASLDAGGKVPVEQIPSGVVATNGTFLGVIDANGATSKFTNDNGATQTAIGVASASPNSYFIVSVDSAPGVGQLAADGISTLTAGDKVQSNGTLWLRILKEAQGIGTGLITSDMIFNNTIVANDIASNTITNAELGVDSVGASELADNAVDNAAIANGAITFSKMQTTGFGTGSGDGRVMIVDTSNALSLATLKPHELVAPAVGVDVYEFGLNMNGNAVTGLPTSPSALSDAASKSYVDSVAGGGSGALINLGTKDFLGGSTITGVGKYIYGNSTSPTAGITNWTVDGNQPFSEIHIKFENCKVSRTGAGTSDFRLCVISSVGSVIQVFEMGPNSASSSSNFWTLNGTLKVLNPGDLGSTAWTVPVLDYSGLFYTNTDPAIAPLAYDSSATTVFVIGLTWTSDSTTKLISANAPSAIKSINILLNTGTAVWGSSVSGEDGHITMYGVKR